MVGSHLLPPISIEFLRLALRHFSNGVLFADGWRIHWFTMKYVSWLSFRIEFTIIFFFLYLFFCVVCIRRWGIKFTGFSPPLLVWLDAQMDISSSVALIVFFFCLRNVTAEEHGVYILSFFFLPLDWTTWSFLPSASANERKCLLRLKGYAIIRLPHVRSEKKKSPSVFRRSRIFFPVSPRRLLSVPCRVSIRLVINIKAGLQVKMTCSLHFILFLFRSNFCCFFPVLVQHLKVFHFYPSINRKDLLYTTRILFKHKFFMHFK